MKKETKTKKVTKVVLDYKKMYESMKVLADNLSAEVNYKADLAFDRAAIIEKLRDRLKESKQETVFWSIGTLLLGIAFGLFF